MKKQLLGIACLAVVVVSCKSDNNLDPDKSDGSTKYLEQLTVTDGDDIYSYKLSYDNQQQLVTYHSDEEETTHTVTYDSQGNAIKIDIQSEDTRVLYEINYNNQGVPQHATAKLTQLSNPSEVYQSNLTYEITNGKIAVLKLVDHSGIPLNYHLDYTGNNLTKISIGNEGGVSEIFLKYGTKKSPYSGARFKYALIPDILFNFVSENELIEAKTSFSGIGEIVVNYTYQYDAAGYPISAKEWEDGEVTSTTNFQYR